MWVHYICPANNSPDIDCGGGVTVKVPFACPPVQQPPSCPSGQVSGYLSGKFVCVDAGGGSTSTGSTSTGSTGSTSSTSTGSTTSTSTSSGLTSSGLTSSGSGFDSAGIIDAINGLKGDGAAKTVTKGGKRGDFGQGASDSLIQVKADLDIKIEEVKSGLNVLKPSLSGVAVLPSWNFGTIRGVDIKLDLNDYSGILGVISTAIIFLASIMAFRIVLGG